MVSSTAPRLGEDAGPIAGADDDVAMMGELGFGPARCGERLAAGSAGAAAGAVEPSVDGVKVGKRAAELPRFVRPARLVDMPAPR